MMIIMLVLVMLSMMMIITVKNPIKRHEHSMVLTPAVLAVSVLPCDGTVFASTQSYTLFPGRLDSYILVLLKPSTLFLQH